MATVDARGTEVKAEAKAVLEMMAEAAGLREEAKMVAAATAAAVMEVAVMAVATAAVAKVEAVMAAAGKAAVARVVAARAPQRQEPRASRSWTPLQSRRGLGED